MNLKCKSYKEMNIKGLKRTDTYKKAAQWLKDHDMSKEIKL